MTQAYPLQWPVGQPRTPGRLRKSSAFTQGGFLTPDKATRELLHEIRLLGGGGATISTNVPIRRDGLPYADAARRRMDDPGVAVYFELKGRPQVFACDKWETIPENIRAICKTIEALRGIERWGSGDMMERAFTGFAALPPPITNLPRPWWDVLKVTPTTPLAAIEAQYRGLAKEAHPDAPNGSESRMAELNAAIVEARKAGAV